MAGDWIKVERSTPDKPEVMRIARRLGVSRDEAFGKLFRFWSWLDGNCVEGVVEGVVSTDVDDVVGVEGFAESLRRVGWLEFDDEAEVVSVTNFDRHNGNTAKARLKKAEYQATYRAKRRASVEEQVSTPVEKTIATNTSPREEKRIEENNKENTPLPPVGDAKEEFASGNLNVIQGGMVIPCRLFREYVDMHPKKTHYRRAAYAWNKVVKEGNKPEDIIGAFETSPRVVQASSKATLPNPFVYLDEYCFTDPPVTPDADADFTQADNHGFSFGSGND